MDEIAVSADPEGSRYEARVAGEVAGFAEYLLAKDLVVFTHTEVDPRFEGQGVGSAIARFALDDVRADGSRRVLALCPFIKGWIERHPDYQPLAYQAPASTATD